jgi:hypothetical protein
MLNIFNSFFSFFVELSFLTGASMEKRNQRRKTISSKKVEIYSPIEYAISVFALSKLFSVSRASKCTTLIDMFECVFQVGLMMCNSTFSTTTKCAFPIFILNYTFFALARSFSLVMQENFIVRSRQHMQ